MLQEDWEIDDPITVAYLEELSKRANSVPNMVHRANTNVCVAIGDSITAIGELPAIGDMYLSQICMQSNQRVKFGGTFALGGTHLQVLRDTYLPMVLAMDPLPGACIIFACTNDVANTGSTWSLPGRAAMLKEMVASLTDKGVLPILVAIPPHSDNAAWQPRVQAWNTWIRRYASTHGFPLLDAYTATAGVDGNYKASYSTDGIHPTPMAHKAIADRAIKDGIAEVFPAQPSVQTRRSTADLTTLFNNGTINLGLFTTGSGGIGTGLNLIPGGDSVQTLVDPTEDDDLLGKWQELSRTTGDDGDVFLFNVLSGWTAGDTLAFSARIQTEGIIASNTPWSVCLQISDGEAGLSGWHSDLDGLLYVEVPLPDDNDMVWFKIDMGPVGGTGTAKVRAGEVTIVNLTTGGLLV